MNDADVGKQIQQMVRFILQEAEEKASEISVAAEEVMNQCSDLPTSRYQILSRLLQEFKDPIERTLTFGAYMYHARACRSSTSRSCSWWSRRRSESGRTTIARRSRWTSAGRCERPLVRVHAINATLIDIDHPFVLATAFPRLN
jgi:hypothetical protein